MDKPVKKFVTYDRYEGNYDLCHPNEKQVQYIFKWNSFADKAKELNLKASFVISMDEDNGYNIDCYSALDLARELEDVFDGYWISTSKNSIKAIVKFLEAIDEENEDLKEQYLIENAEYQVDYWTNELNKLKSVCLK